MNVSVYDVVCFHAPNVHNSELVVPLDKPSKGHHPPRNSAATRCPALRWLSRPGR